jgi:hypothetical protein
MKICIYKSDEIWYNKGLLKLYDERMFVSIVHQHLLSISVCQRKGESIMTFEEFKTTKAHQENLDTIGNSYHNGKPRSKVGFTYLNNTMVIEDLTGLKDANNYNSILWRVQVGTDEYLSYNLTEMEYRLYWFALEQGHISRPLMGKSK